MPKYQNYLTSLSRRAKRQSKKVSVVCWKQQEHAQLQGRGHCDYDYEYDYSDWLLSRQFRLARDPTEAPSNAPSTAPTTAAPSCTQGGLGCSCVSVAGQFKCADPYKCVSGYCRSANSTEAPTGVCCVCVCVCVCVCNVRDYS